MFLYLLIYVETVCRLWHIVC